MSVNTFYGSISSLYGASYLRFFFHCSYNCWSFLQLSCLVFFYCLCFFLFFIFTIYRLSCYWYWEIISIRRLKGRSLRDLYLFCMDQRRRILERFGKGKKEEGIGSEKKKPIKNFQNKNMYLTYLYKGK